MTNLAIANIKHRKLRSCLACLGVMIGIASLITMLSLSHGTLDEVARRMESIDADLIVLPSKSSLIFSEGAPLSDKYIEKIKSVRLNGQKIVAGVYPVYLTIIPSMAGQQQRVFGIRKSDFKIFTRNRKLISGSLFDGEFGTYVNELRKSLEGNYQPEKIDKELLEKACQVVIDDRLARAGHYKVGDKVSFLGKDFVICGIVESGGAGRVFAPIEVVRFIQNGGIKWSSLFFIKLDKHFVKSSEAKDKSGRDIEVSENSDVLEQSAKAIRKAVHLRVVPLSSYNQMLFESFKPIYIYINIASGLVLLVSFLFVMVTIYTIVLERRKEIGILRSMGADSLYILKQTIGEAMIISLFGTFCGIIVSYVARWAIESYRPLLTVDIESRWLILALCVGLAGSFLSALYPGIKAIREDPVSALNYE